MLSGWLPDGSSRRILTDWESCPARRRASPATVGRRGVWALRSLPPSALKSPPRVFGGGRSASEAPSFTNRSPSRSPLLIKRPSAKSCKVSTWLSQIGEMQAIENWGNVGYVNLPHQIDARATRENLETSAILPDAVTVLTPHWATDHCLHHRPWLLEIAACQAAKQVICLCRY
eukprot:COSAG05_NODE_1202_length_5536_cov_1.814420_5_plen_174_part_00